MTSAGRATFSIFALEDTAVQVMWRGLQPGPLRIEVPGPAITVEVDDPAPAGAATITGLAPNAAFELRATGPALGSALLRATGRTLPSPPGAELTRLATIGDLHLGTHSFGHWGTIREADSPEVPHPRRCAEAAIDEATAWGASRMVAKGDLTNRSRVDEWREFAALVQQSPIPVDALPGNHDQLHVLWRNSLSPADAQSAFGFDIATPLLVRDLPGVRLVLADSTTPGRNRGTLSGVEADLIDAVADAPRDVSVLVAMHHQLHSQITSEGWPVGIGHRDSKRLLARLGAAHPHVLLTSGHTHRHRRWERAGVVATQVGSTKDYPGVWAGYVIHEGGIRQVVNRVARPDCVAWTDHTRRAALGAWRYVAPGPLTSRCFSIAWTDRSSQNHDGA